MFGVNVNIIRELQAFLRLCIADTSLLDLFRQSPRHFTRSRKLSFSRLVLFITKLCKKTLSVELEQFFKQDLNQPDACTISAFSQQRKKLKGKFFSIWNQVLCNSFYHYAAGTEHIRRWHGFRLLAADGSVVSLITSNTLYKHFGGQRNQHRHFCGAKAFFHYDVLNRLFVRSHLDCYRTSEHQMAYQSIDTLPADTLTLYDRNFCCYKMIALHRWSEQERRFVIRAKENCRFVSAFLKSGAYSTEIAIYPEKEAIEGLGKSGFVVTKTTALKVRLVRVILPNGEVEVLLTNLWEREGYGVELFGPLYNMRWGIETAIGLAKNLLQLESFSGLSVAAVEQDFYATVLLANLEALLSRQAEEERQQQNDRLAHAGEPVKVYKYPLQVNHNKASGKLRQRLVHLMSEGKPQWILQELSAYFQKHVLPVRKGRCFNRQRRQTQSKSKHRTYANYKPAT